jgi:hypothetical protein
MPVSAGIGLKAKQIVTLSFAKGRNKAAKHSHPEIN